MRIIPGRVFPLVTISSVAWFLRAARFSSALCTSSFVSQARCSACNSLTHRWLSETSEEEEEEEDPLHWERLYQQGEIQKMADDNLEILQQELSKSEVRVVSFDLDNTLWKTSATISAANDALAAFLDDHDIVQPTRVEKVMGQLFKASKSRYCPLNDDENAKAPVLLTMLRKDAIQYILEEHNGYSAEESEELAKKAFEAWVRARHDAIPLHFADSVVPCLERIRSLSASTGHPVLVGAITDGNSSPELVEGLSDYFDFCVNAESVGVAKPDKRVYLAAMKHVAHHPFMQDLFGPFLDELTEEIVENIVGPWWVHVGDDFVKDVVAAKGLRMRSIWARELISKASTSAQKDGTPAKKRSLEDLIKEVSEMKVVEMQIGAEDFLVDSIRSEFADAVVDRFEDLSEVIFDWHQQALDSKTPLPPHTNEEAEKLSVIEAPVAPRVSVEEAISETAASPTEAQKFCVFCGTKLPAIAKFCVSCGEKQPEL